jgi:hypothetical protein
MNVEHQMNVKAAQLPPGSLRQTVLLVAKKFKSSWVELGKLLVKVRNEALFEEWGYPSFESYCLAELRIKKNTADKLTRNFTFLDKHEPQAVSQPDIIETAPPFEVVEVLAQAEERGQLSANEYKSIRDSIWNQERPVSELKRELVDRFPPPQKDSTDSELVKKLWSASKRLVAELHANKKIPSAIAERAQAVADDLEELLTQKAKA